MRPRDTTTIAIATAVLLVALGARALVGGEAKAEPPPAPDRAALIAAAREIMAAQTYCALVTIDETGRPQVRTMNPFPPDDDMVVWMATNTRRRKVQQIRKDPRVSLPLLLESRLGDRIRRRERTR